MSEVRGRLGGKTVAVVGASGCYGAAVARALAREGASLVLGSRSREPLQELQRELEDAGRRVLVIGTDVTRQRHLERLVEVALESFGTLNALVYAPSARPASLESLEAGAWGEAVDVNIRGFLYASGAALPAMLERGGGHLVDLDVIMEDGALHRAGSWTRREALDELHARFSDRGVVAIQVRAEPHDGGPERCAEAVLRALSSAPRTPTERLLP
jgi:NADP-dependent 3-hydroxy acid dehydrogenase YdfG